jgi:hypothetical protein
MVPETIRSIIQNIVAVMVHGLGVLCQIVIHIEFVADQYSYQDLVMNDYSFGSILVDGISDLIRLPLSVEQQIMDMV